MQAKDATTNSKNLTTGGLTVTMSVNGSATLSSVSDNADGTYTALLNLIVFEVNVKLTSTTLPTSEPSKAALTLTVSTVLLVIVAVTQTQVTSSTNSAAYGDIYQWGRRKDGHESRGSGKISTRLASITATDNRYMPTEASSWDSKETG
jgi:hypothetical protein